MAQWDWSKWLVFSVPFLLVLLGVGIFFLLRGTFRSRYKTEKALRDDPDINEWLVVFNWSRKVLYLPFIVVSLIAGILALIFPAHNYLEFNRIMGGIWIGLFFLNFLIDEYEISIKLILIVVLTLVVLFLWLGFLGWITGFLNLFGRIKVVLPAAAYFFFAAILALAVTVSWLKGLFYYVAITPNYMNIQVGPTETGEQIGREEYSTRIDTGDFLERLQGFGRIVVTFADHRRQPMVLLVGRIGKAAARLESIRGKLAFDRHQPSREGAGPGDI